MQTGNSRFCHRRSRCAFTLVELLLVVAIMGILAAITLPNFARSMRGNRIRVATRAVVSASRYARNISILRGSEHALVLDLEKNTIFVSGVVSSVSRTAALPEAPVDGTGLQVGDGTNLIVSANLAFADQGEMTRNLDGVNIRSVEMYGGVVHAKGIAVVVFESNGRCDPFEVKLEDAEGKAVLIKVDALACVETMEAY